MLSRNDRPAVTVYDNFSSGREWHVEALQERFGPKVDVVRGDVREEDLLTRTLSGHDAVVHLASNPDIAAAVERPSIDFEQGTELTHHVAEAARRSGVGLVLYASGSGVYGDIGDVEAHEDRGPLVPTSTYAASKLAGEALLASYAFMFGLVVRAFRFGNVVGPRQTHGVGYDFVRRLTSDSTRLRILGDGQQSKSYIHVDDVVRAVLTAADQASRDLPYQVYNVATGDYVTVTEIADLATRVLGIPEGETTYEYTGGDRGWKGDVPVVRLNTDRIRSLGWRNQRTGPEAIAASLESLRADLLEGLLT